MATKELRILIADEQHTHRVFLEKSLNRLGYFRIAPIQLAEELLTLTCHLHEPFGFFDALIMNIDMTINTEMEIEQFCFDILKVKNVLIYGIKTENWTRVLSCAPESVEIHLLEKVDDLSVLRFMEHVDPGTKSDICSNLRTEMSFGRNNIPIKYFAEHKVL